MALNLEDYDIIPPHLSTLTSFIVEVWQRLGKPTDPLSEAGQKLVNFVFDSYEELYPQEYKAWRESIKEYQLAEKTLTEQVRKHTGRSLISYPYWVFMILKKLFPNFDFVKRENALKIAKTFKQFQVANKV
jgi:hypothetical protein